MNQHLKNIQLLLQQNNQLTESDKEALAKTITDADMQWATTDILLEETIEDLEQKRKIIEAQKRELEIEASLEKVRMVALSMNEREDMMLVCRMISEQLELLNVKEIRNIQTAIFYEERGTYMNYEYYAKHDKTLITETIYTNHEIAKAFAAKMLKGRGEVSITLIKGEEKVKEWLTYQKSTNVFIDTFLETASSLNYYWFSLGPVALGISTYTALSDDELNLFKRFLNVFELAYRRYLDIEKATAQAKEAQIEAALEKIRSRSLAMHRSDELKEVIAIVFEKLKELNVLLGSVGIWLFDKKTMHSVFWIGNNLLEPTKVNLPYDGKLMKENTVYRDSWQAWLSGNDYVNKEYNFGQKNKYFDYVFANNDLTTIPAPVRTYMLQVQKYIAYLMVEKNSSLYVDCWNGEFYSDASLNIIKRAAKVFEQAYVRFLDLQKAEAQTREAQIEAALEKVRSSTMAMHKSDELAETSSVVFKQLIGLGISPNRLYISIIKDNEGETEFWITDEDGNKVSMAYKDNLNNNPSFKKIFDGWKQQKKSLVIDMKGKELQQYFKYLSSIHIPFKEGLTQKRRLQYIAYFSKGFIGMASPDEQSAETLQLLERFAYVFNLTFVRFNDLQIAEAHAFQAEHDLIEIKAARSKAEETLAELQSTQKQLIQSEKMASLGELTAGIAHEIQNPLNFVNNFSEVSKELIDEMKAELETGNMQHATEIANDIIQNLEKINHHGKRADAIVKGMLQHSRKSSGQKELTDINALCDEYVRLCYHGLRAKDKSFNAIINTDFDMTIEKINVIPQDIGRALLNILTNAFYVVNEKQKAESLKLNAVYKPTVSVQTKKENNNIEIKVTDNGNGIPQNIIDKIFQPFFTTKPTGEGTGLGLSLAYDIITKEHGGTIKVESKEGEGSSFIINLPIA